MSESRKGKPDDCCLRVVVVVEEAGVVDMEEASVVEDGYCRNQ